MQTPATVYVVFHHTPLERKHTAEGKEGTHRGQGARKPASAATPLLNPHSRRGLHTRTDTYTKLTSDTGCMEGSELKYHETAHNSPPYEP